MKTIGVLGTLLHMCLLSAGIATAADRPFVLEQHAVKGGPSTFALRLKSRESGRIIWQRSLENPRVTWSPDGRAVAVEAEHRTVLLWRQGYRLRTFAAPDGSDATMGCAWSPDNRRLLVRGIKSGEGMIGAGTLFCIRLHRWPWYHCSRVSSGVGHWTWSTNRIVLYWLLDYPRHIPKKKPNKWWSP